MQEKTPSGGPKGVSGVDPYIARLRQYKKTALEKGVPWELADRVAISLMQQPCSICGTSLNGEGGDICGITRLRSRPGAQGMGPYTEDNTASACTPCNMMKGAQTLKEP
ncbi:hypothetical protein CYMTET_44807 [Cymbomonas tetramitiformis]|uniref:HNH endonuclease n=1 Tax=Cymbomonas tetramitiformis TaxID=36881 RepID=A0AAE0BZH0_9CHLO|nr:hypothetical protein CYMTET_44807 [Cymbomonas tetramitiformis]